jgi:hypothetical protein
LLRLAAAWALWCLALALGLWFGCALPGWARGLLCLLALAALWRGGRQLLGRPGGVDGGWRWEADGRWRSAGRFGPAAYVAMDPPRRLGPCLWLRWQAASGHRYLLVDGAGMEPKALALIKARMKFSRAP